MKTRPRILGDCDQHKAASFNFTIQVFISNFNFKSSIEISTGLNLGVGQAGTCPGSPHFRGPKKMKVLPSAELDYDQTPHLN